MESKCALGPSIPSKLTPDHKSELNSKKSATVAEPPDVKRSSSPAEAKSPSSVRKQALLLAGALPVTSASLSTNSAAPSSIEVERAEARVKQLNLSSQSPRKAEAKRDYEFWKGTQGLLRRATAFVYRRIIAPREEGGYRGFFDQHCADFAGSNKDSEYKAEWTELHQEYERLVESALEAFVATEQEVGSTAELLDLVKDLMESEEGERVAGKQLGLLLGAADFRRFCRMMRQRGKVVAAADPLC